MKLSLSFVAVALAHILLVGSVLSAPIRVAIIGGGTAGLKTARDVMDYSRRGEYDVMVFEARNRLGGRIFTDRTFGVGADADFGASWIHGAIGRNPVYDLAVNQGGLKTQLTNFNSQGTWSDPSGTGDGPSTRLPSSWMDVSWAKYDALMTKHRNTRDALTKEISLGQHLVNIDRAAYYDQDVLFHMSTTTEFNSGTSVFDLSAWGWEDDRWYGPADHLVNDGFSNIVGLLVNGTGRLQDPIPYRLGHILARVTTQAKEMEDNNCPYFLEFRNGYTHCADVVVMAVPLGVIRSGDIAFVPPLPFWKTDAFSRIGLGFVNKIALKFPSKFWDDSQFFGIVSPSEVQGPFNFWINPYSLTRTNILIGVAIGEAGEIIESMSDSEVVAEAMKRIRLMYRSAPDPIDFRITRWGSDPFTRGSYSFAKVGMKYEGAGHDRSADWSYAETPIGNMFFAGEYTTGDYRGTVHGAMTSGEYEADRILSRFGSK